MRLYAAIVALAFMPVAYSANITAFSAGITVGGTVPAGRVIVFNDVMVNQGNAYNGNTGVFTAPKGGLYLFQVNFMTVWTKNIFAKLYKNDAAVVTVYGYNNNIGHYIAGNNVLVSLKKGDIVYVKSFSVSDIYVGRNNVIMSLKKGDIVYLKTFIDSDIAVSTDKYSSFLGYAISA